MSEEIEKARKEAMKKLAEGADVDKMKKRAAQRKDDLQARDYIEDVHGEMVLSPGKLNKKTKGHPYSVRESIRKKEEKKLSEWKERKKSRYRQKIDKVLKKRRKDR